VIIDSDGGIDDLKAICMMMASPDVRILAITVSDGFHKAPVAYENIRKMVDALHHEGLPWLNPERQLHSLKRCLLQRQLLSNSLPWAPENGSEWQWSNPPHSIPG
jgi:hypothetical protein